MDVQFGVMKRLVGMKTALLRAGVLAAVAAGFCVALSLTASADVVEPKSATQPAAVGLLQEEAAKAAVPDAGPQGFDPKAAEAMQEPVDEVVATPAPEQVVRQAPAHFVRPNTDVHPAPSVVERVTHPLRMGFQQIGASLGRVVGACEVGFGSGAGGPVLVFAVLSVLAPFIRRRVFMARGTTDERVSDFLLVRELTPPG
jgi:hypothetical protein